MQLLMVAPFYAPKALRACSERTKHRTAPCHRPLAASLGPLLPSQQPVPPSRDTESMMKMTLERVRGLYR